MPDVSPLLSRRAWACLTMLALTGAVFVLKYGARVPGLSERGSIAVALVFAVAYIAAIVGARVASSAPWLRDRRWLLTAGAVLGLASVVVLAALSPDVSRVARSPAIADWLGRLANGQFPYGPPTDPSGFPGLFLLAAPFWALGALWLIAPVGTALAWALVRRAGGAASLAGWVGLMLFPPTFYEALVRSELVFNGALSMGAVLVAEWARRRDTGGALILAGLATGLVLSTRLSAALVLVVYGVWLLRRAPQFAMRYGILAASVFALTLAPLVLWSPDAFIEVGPFAVQGAYLPLLVQAAVVVAALLAGWVSRNAGDVLTSAGILIWLSVLVAFGIQVNDIGWAPTVWGDGFDLAYFVLPAPLLLWGAVRDDST
ncbi:MAG: hypothetical protein Rubg2KO_24940 [Rubricoccaceae bacterium]